MPRNSFPTPPSEEELDSHVVTTMLYRPKDKKRASEVAGYLAGHRNLVIQDITVTSPTDRKDSGRSINVTSEVVETGWDAAVTIVQTGIVGTVINKVMGRENHWTVSANTPQSIRVIPVQ